VFHSRGFAWLGQLTTGGVLASGIVLVQGGVQPLIAQEIAQEIAQDVSQPTPPVLPPVETLPQPDPNVDRIPQPGPPAEPLPAETAPPLTTPPPETQSTPDPPAKIPVQKIEIKGSTIFQPADFAKIIQPLEGRSVTLEELQQVADAITQLYLDKGYITTRAVLVDQTIQAGVVQIQIIEGRVNEIKLEGNRRVRDRYVLSRLRLGTKVPLQRQQLEDQLRLLKADPLFKNIEASLRPGKSVGESLLFVRVVEANPYLLNLSVDNYSSPAIGGERVGILLGHRNLTGNGDLVSMSYNRTGTGGANVFDLNYRIPVNAKNGTLQFRVAPNDTKITDPEFNDFGIRSTTELYEVSFRQPLIRSPRQELALSLGYTYQSNQGFIFEDIPTPFSLGPDQDGISTTSVIKFGQDYVRRDVQGAWAFRSQLSFGTGLFDSTRNDRPIPDGEFVSWLGQAQRLQVFGNDRLLFLSADLQLTPNSLLPQQQFVIGGGQSVRGYRQNVRAGDNGFRFSAEGRLPLLRDEGGKPIMQAAPFFDAGVIWNQADNPNPLRDQSFLAGLGFGLLWEPFPRFNLRLDYGFPLVELDDKGGNVQDSGFYFSVNYRP
jgi:hemolysin activation/secretion protein